MPNVKLSDVFFYHGPGPNSMKHCPFLTINTLHFLSLFSLLSSKNILHNNALRVKITNMYFCLNIELVTGSTRYSVDHRYCTISLNHNTLKHSFIFNHLMIKQKWQKLNFKKCTLIGNKGYVHMALGKFYKILLDLFAHLPNI